MRHRFAFCCVLFVAANAALFSYRTDERGNKVSPKLWVGLVGNFNSHFEKGLDSTKGDYSASYLTAGGVLAAQYFFEDYYLAGGFGFDRLLTLAVNDFALDMQSREQWHVPVFLRGFLPLTESFAVGAGFTYLTETIMYLNGQSASEKAYAQLFLDLALDYRYCFAEKWCALASGIVGMNLYPGRQHTYSPGDLFHSRLELNLGALYALY